MTHILIFLHLYRSESGEGLSPPVTALQVLDTSYRARSLPPQSQLLWRQLENAH